MIKQSVKGASPLKINVSLNQVAETNLVPLLAGGVEVFKEVAAGGTPLTATPAVMNRKDLVVGSKELNGNRISWYLSIPHVKQSSSYSEIGKSIIGVFNNHFDLDKKADYARMRFDSAKPVGA